MGELEEGKFGVDAALRAAVLGNSAPTARESSLEQWKGKILQCKPSITDSCSLGVCRWLLQPAELPALIPPVAVCLSRISVSTTSWHGSYFACIQLTALRVAHDRLLAINYRHVLLFRIGIRHALAVQHVHDSEPLDCRRPPDG